MVATDLIPSLKGCFLHLGPRAVLTRAVSVVFLWCFCGPVGFRHTCFFLLLNPAPPMCGSPTQTRRSGILIEWRRGVHPSPLRVFQWIALVFGDVRGFENVYKLE